MEVGILAGLSVCIMLVCQPACNGFGWFKQCVVNLNEMVGTAKCFTKIHKHVGVSSIEIEKMSHNKQGLDKT